MAVYLQHISLGKFTASRAIQYDEALKYARLGHTIYVLYCDGLTGLCFGNMEGDRSICAYCKSCFRNDKRKFGKELNFISMKKLLSPTDEDEIKNMAFEFKEIGDLKRLKYEQAVSIGMAVLSTYVSTTRNINPLFDADFIYYINEALKDSVRVTKVIRKAIMTLKPDKVLLYNGRFMDSKVALEMAEFYHVPYEVSEAVYGIKRNYKIRVYNNSIHNIKANHELIISLWEKSQLPLDKKIEIGKSFFMRRRNAQFAGDKVYTLSQQKGLLPTYWDKKKHNIVIFNSSEDEFFAVGDHYDQYALFPSQLKGLQFIKDWVIDKEETVVTLRVHPNLASIPYSYVQDIKKLESEKFHIIPAESSISTYALLEAADTVVVFGSTIGIESVYWGKPTILLAGSLYYYLGGCYIPKTEDQLAQLLAVDLPPKDNTGAVKYGYFILNEEWDYWTVLNYDWETWKMKFWKKSVVLEIDNWRKLYGSRRLYALWDACKYKFIRFIYFFKGSAKRYMIPVKEKTEL